MKTNRELEKRALAAYIRRAENEIINEHGSGSVLQPSIDTVEHEGLTYICLSNVNGILAVYRVRTVNGEPVLKCLKRWPKALEG